MRLRNNKVYNEKAGFYPKRVLNVEEDEIVYIRDTEFIKGRLIRIKRAVKISVVRATIAPFLNNCIRKSLFAGHAKEIRYAKIYEMLVTTGRVIPPYRTKEALAIPIDDSSDEEYPFCIETSDDDDDQDLNLLFNKQKR